MILDAYYCFVKSTGKSKTRFDVIASTANYEPFESLTNAKGELFLYLTDIPDRFRADVKRKADKNLSAKGRNVSSVFVPDLNLLYAYGDVRATTDAIVVVFNTEYTSFEIFIAKGRRNNRLGLYQMLCDGELQYEIEALRSKANVKVC
jgi:hypothetical protein